MSARVETADSPSCASACANCTTTGLSRLGFGDGRADFVVALAGNPNTGKSTVFNALTGLRQHVGNWTGKTVSRAEGAFRFGGARFRIVDLPGTYSLLSTSADEEVARDFVLFGRPDVTVVVLDAACLERNLGLCLQVLEITNRVVVALNLVDEAERAGISVDARALARELGVPVVATAARSGHGLDELLATVAAVASGKRETQPRVARRLEEPLETEVAALAAGIEELYPGLANARWVALRLVEGDESVARALVDGSLGEIARPRRTLSVLAPQEVC